MTRTQIAVALTLVWFGHDRVAAQGIVPEANDELTQLARLMDSASPAKTWLELSGQHRWVGPVPATEAEAEQRVLARHAQPGRREIRFLAYNTYLLDGAQSPVPIDESVRKLLGAKPMLQERATEIGVATFRDFDVVALSEVFGDREKELLRAGWSDFREASGPAKDRHALTGSGLLTLSKPSIRRTRTHVFQNRGDRVVDPDAWANKGVLMTELDIGVPDSGLEIYSTHLFAGGGLPTTGPVEQVTKGLQKLPTGLLPKRARKLQRVAEKTTGGSAEYRKHSIRIRQMRELVDFYRETHRPGNVALIAGDLNISADEKGAPTREYQELVSVLSEISFHDAWTTRCSGRGPTSNLLRDGGRICPGSEDGTAACREESEVTAGQRIDYLFVQRQAPEQGFTLDFARPARRSFPRDPANIGYDRLKYMSDHIGLSVRLFITPNPKTFE